MFGLSVIKSSELAELKATKSRLISAGQSLSEENEWLKRQLDLAEIQIKWLKHNERDRHGCYLRNKKK